MWIAREESGRLFLFESKPIKTPKCPGLWVNDGVTTPIMEIDSNLFPVLSWTNDPVEVALVPVMTLEAIKNVNEAPSSQHIPYLRSDINNILNNNEKSIV